MPKPHIFTREELKQLDRFDRGVPMLEIAKALGTGHSTVIRWLQQLGMYHRTYAPKGSYEIPWDSPLRCKDCGIILERADEGYHDGRCNYCWGLLEDNKVSLPVYDPTARLVALEDAQRFS